MQENYARVFDINAHSTAEGREAQMNREIGELELLQEVTIKDIEFVGHYVYIWYFKSNQLKK